MMLSVHVAAVLVTVLAGAVAPSNGARLPYIVNGNYARPGEFPWQASLQTGRLFHSHICGASLISEEWLVTASHCVTEISSMGVGYYSVVLGAHDKDSKKMGKPKRYSIDQIIMHPSYTIGGSAAQLGDIALMKVSGKVDTASKFVSAIELAGEGEEFWGMDCVISGWGSMYGANTQLPNVLKMLDVKVLTKDQCAAKGGNHICVEKRGSSACTGDSGGPLACKKDGVWKLVGAASYVFGDCIVLLPSVYTSVPFYRQWIAGITGV